MQKIVIFKAKFPKNGKFQGIFFFAFFASFSLQRIFFAKIFFVCKESLLAIQYSVIRSALEIEKLSKNLHTRVGGGTSSVFPLLFVLFPAHSHSMEMI